MTDSPHSRHGLLGAALVLGLAVLTVAACARGPQAGPNVLLVLVDDLGWADTGAYGSTFYATPNIDRLAAEGMLFRDATATSPVCSPTRASIFSGKHPARLHITNWIGGQQNGLLLQAEYEHELALEEATLGEAFSDAGYATGYIGKWHLGTGAYRPENQGFQITIAVNDGGQPASYFHPYRREKGSHLDVPDLGDGAPDEYLTDRLTDEAIAFIEAHQREPFLLVLSHYAVHTPLQAKPELIARYEATLPSQPPQAAFALEHGRATTRVRQDHPVYAAMVHSTDESVGRLLTALSELGLSEHTIVVFVSDNGGLSTLAGDRTTAPTSNAPLRAGKGWLYEGGIRIPLIVRWPGAIEAGTSSKVPASTTDLYPTLLELAGLAARPQQHLDGVSLASVLRGGQAPARDTRFWHFPHYHGSGNRPSAAIRARSLKLIEWFEDDAVELYDLSVDPGEALDLAAQRPEEVRRLRQQLESWRRRVDALMPRPGPDAADR